MFLIESVNVKLWNKSYAVVQHIFTKMQKAYQSSWSALYIKGQNTVMSFISWIEIEWGFL